MQKHLKGLTRDQSKAVEAYEFRLREEDRYLSSVFANTVGQCRVEEATKAAYEHAKRLGVGHLC